MQLTNNQRKYCLIRFSNNNNKKKSTNQRESTQMKKITETLHNIYTNSFVCDCIYNKRVVNIIFHRWRSYNAVCTNRIFVKVYFFISLILLPNSAQNKTIHYSALEKLHINRKFIITENLFIVHSRFDRFSVAQLFDKTPKLKLSSIRMYVECRDRTNCEAINRFIDSMPINNLLNPTKNTLKATCKPCRN